MKYAVCNELFGDLTLADSCRLLADHGFTGIELAPYTLAEDPHKLGAVVRSEIRKTLQAFDLEFVGLHWLLKVPEGLHLTTPDAVIRKKSWDFLKFLIEFCAEMGGGMMILGSGKQRSAESSAVESALAYISDGLRELAPLAESGNTKILLEPLATHITNVVNTMQEAEAIIEAVDHPAVGGILDFHNCTGEKLTWPELIVRHQTIIKHIHFNEPDGGYPGAGGYDFLPAFKALQACGYSGWISLEIFNQTDPPEMALQETRRVIQHIERALGED